MRGDIPHAALRLLNALPVRTHERRAIISAGAPMNIKPITIDGNTYRSTIEAKKSLHISTETIHKWLASGRARHA